MFWSGDIPTKYRVINMPFYPDEAVVDLEFNCSKCGRNLLAEGIEILRPRIGDTEEESRIWGDTETVECECGKTYDVSADNCVAGWMVEIENEKPSATFGYKEAKDYGEIEEDHVL